MTKGLINQSIPKLKKWVKGVFEQNSTTPNASDYELLPAGPHGVSRERIAKSAIEVVEKLNSAGFEAYLVGGGVRDQMLGLKPKDFDVATSAHPEEVKALFRNCRLIGRRFRLAHVYFGREVIEVATFRTTHEGTDSSKHAATGEEGMILRDNVYGTAAEDAIRRDFTVNAIYYDLQNNALRDYCSGVADIEKRQLRLIGDPATRYREDPVRMLRAARFAAKLGFEIEPETQAPIAELSPLLGNIPPARLFEESLKLFLGGCATTTYDVLKQQNLFQYLFPQTDAVAEHNPVFTEMLRLAMNNTDSRLAQNKPVTPAFLNAVFLWGPVQEVHSGLLEQGIPPVPALHQAASDVVGRQIASTSIPKRFLIPMREIWDLQGRLIKRHGRQVDNLVRHPRFRAAYDFLLLREACGEIATDAGPWWTQYQEANEQQRKEMLQSRRKGQPNKNSRRRRKNNSNKKPNGKNRN